MGTRDVVFAVPTAGGPPVAASVMDVPDVRAGATFGLCMSPGNPSVAAAQGAPSPCVPMIHGPWLNGSSTVAVAGSPAITTDSTCQCTYGGLVRIADPGASPGAG